MKNRLYNGGKWNEAKFKAFVISGLRAYMKRWEPLWEAKVNAKVGKKINKRSGRLAEHYKCASCNESFVASDVQVDHINPVVSPKEGFKNWQTFINRLYCEIDNLQVLCKKCHKEKTNAERKERMKNK